MNEYTFFRVYKSLVEDPQGVSNQELKTLYLGLYEKALPDFKKWFWARDVDRLDQALAIDAVAHAIHKQGDPMLQVIFPGADAESAKILLDELAGMEIKSELRRPSRGYFSTLLSKDGIVFLEKSQQVGRVTKGDILPAIKEYERLYKVGIISPAEILTLSRFYPDDMRYSQAVQKMGLNNPENEPMVIGGPASVEAVDREGHLITTEALERAFTKFMQNFRERNLNILHCLSPDTEVFVWRKGYISVKDVKVGDKVVSHVGKSRGVVNVFEHHNLDNILLKVKLDNGKDFSVTPDHRLLGADGCWKEAHLFSVGDTLMTVDLPYMLANRVAVCRVCNGKVNFGREKWTEFFRGMLSPVVHNGTKIVSIEEVPYNGNVYNLEVEEDRSFAGRGVIFHNSDVTVGWVLPAYISRNGAIFKSGVDDKQLWVIAELRNDTRISGRVKEEIEKGKLKSYSIAGSATKAEMVSKGDKRFLQVDEMELAEVTLCFISGTKVWTPDGLRPIEDIKVGDKVYSSGDIVSPVSNIFKREYHGTILDITTSNGHYDFKATMSITPEHPVRFVSPFLSERLVFKEKWVKAGELKVGDYVMRCSFKPSDTKSISCYMQCTVAVITSIAPREYCGPVYNIEVEKYNAYYVEAAYVHNCEVGVNQGASFDILKSLPQVSMDMLLKSFSDQRVFLPEFFVMLETGENPKVVLKADRSNSLTDSLVQEIQKFLPKGTEIVVDNMLKTEQIPVYKLALVPIWEK